MFLTERKKQIRYKTNETSFADQLYFSNFIFKKSHGFIEEHKPSEIVVNRFDIDEIDNFEGLPRFVFINEECRNLKVVNDGGELTGDINQKKKSNVSQQPVDVHSVSNAGESISSISLYNIVNQLGKHDFSYGSVVNNLKERKLFSDQMNRNRFDPIPARRDWNCSIVQNLRNLKLRCN